MKIIYILYGVTAFLALGIGLFCWKRRSLFPDADAECPEEEAAEGAGEWDRAREYAGKICFFGGIAAFVLLPLLLALFRATRGVLMGFYFGAAAVWILLVIFLPIFLLNRRLMKRKKEPF